MNLPRTSFTVYVLVAAVVWTSIISAVSVVLRGTPYIGQVLPILLGGTLIFVILVPLYVLRPPTRRP